MAAQSSEAQRKDTVGKIQRKVFGLIQEKKEMEGEIQQLEGENVELSSAKAKGEEEAWNSKKAILDLVFEAGHERIRDAKKNNKDKLMLR